MKAHAADRARIAVLLATLVALLALGTAGFAHAAQRNVIGEMWSADG